MGMRPYRIRDFMTVHPHSIGPNRPLRAAHELMRAHRIRHLPVLDEGMLVGILSDRDLHLIETFKDVDPAEVAVSEAMTPDPFVVPGDALLSDVARTMWQRKLGSAVVMDGDALVGIFTVTDATGALAYLLFEQEGNAVSAAPELVTQSVGSTKSPARKPTRRKPAARTANVRRKRTPRNGSKRPRG